ncbi:MAG: alkaline phosphatase family protein [Verrucomicrobiales bacterium]
MRYATVAAALIVLVAVAVWRLWPLKMDFASTAEKVGHGVGRHVMPDHSIITPAGRQVELPSLRPQGVALSPDGRMLVTSGKTAEVVVIDPDTAEIIQRVSLPSESDTSPPPVSPNILNPDQKGQLSFTGLIFAPDGTRLFLSNVNGSIKVFSVGADRKLMPSFSIALPPAHAPDRKAEIPAGLALSEEGRRLYVACNLSNRCAEIDIATGSVVRTWDVGAAPYDVARVGRKLFVSNWGGRRPDGTGPVAHAGSGMQVRIDPRTGAASEGSVSVIDLDAGRVTAEILTGRHASGLAVSPDGRHVVVANAADDNLSVIDTTSQAVVEKIWPKKTPADLFGAAPNAPVFSDDGKSLFVCNGSQNAVAVIEFRPGRSELEGLIPTGWYPGAIVFDRHRRAVHVANIKGHGSGAKIGEGEKRKFISTQYFGTLSLIPLPATPAELQKQTETVVLNHRGPMLRTAFARPRPFRKPRPVPERVGEPSVFQHVLYIIKENRTYDQVLGDMKEGEGDPELCVFGERVTPNQHRIAREFVLLDNTYCSGILSADGHNWSCSAITTDYMEKQFAGFPRSYPDGFDDADADALAWSPAGFIWDAALAQGKTIRIFGEFTHANRGWTDPEKPGKPNWTEVWQDFQKSAAGGGESGAVWISARATIHTLKPHVSEKFAGWDQNVSDLQRAEAFLAELREWERTGAMPNLMVMSLPMDHTSGTSPGFPTPAAQVADNDLAFARIVEAISRSRFWQDTCILAIEDDPQNGWDHVSGYRTTAYVVSAWTRRRAVVHTQYNQASVVRTIELILGLPPMNEIDATATPMFDCFTDEPDFTPFTAVPAHVALDELNPPAAAIADPMLREQAIASAGLPLHKLDACPEDELNRILWHAMKGSSAKFPQWAVSLVEEEEEE